jgi:hypothetical protein
MNTTDTLTIADAHWFYAGYNYTPEHTNKILNALRIMSIPLTSDNLRAHRFLYS